MSGSSGISSTDYSNLIARVSRLEDSSPKRIRGNGLAGQGRNGFLPLASAGVTSAGKLNLSATAGIDFSGAMAPAVTDGSFSVASPSSTTATIYWDGTNSSRVFVMRAADQTSQTIPGNNISISGLTASAAYSAYPFWVPVNGCGLGFAPGDTGTPLIAFSSSSTDTAINQAQSLQNLAGREAMPVVTWTQPASGGSTSGTKIGNGGTCVRLGTDIQPLGNFRPSEVRTENHTQREWVHIESKRGLVLDATPSHMIYHAERGKVRMDNLTKGDLMITRAGEDELVECYSFIRSCTKVKVHLSHGHLFWANGYLCHNFKTNILP